MRLLDYQRVLTYATEKNQVAAMARGTGKTTITVERCRNTEGHSLVLVPGEHRVTMMQEQLLKIKGASKQSGNIILDEKKEVIVASYREFLRRPYKFFGYYFENIIFEDPDEEPDANMREIFKRKEIIREYTRFLVIGTPHNQRDEQDRKIRTIFEDIFTFAEVLGFKRYRIPSPMATFIDDDNQAEREALLHGISDQVFESEFLAEFI